jgi:hypothetical protein
MARSRILEPDVFSDPDLNSLPPLARWLYIGLWTIADREGRLIDDPRRIKVLTLPFDLDADCDALLDLLAPQYISRYTAEGLPLIQLTRPFKSVHPRETPSAYPAQGSPKANLGVPKANLGSPKAAISVSDSLSVSTGVSTVTSVSGSTGVSVSRRAPNTTREQIKAWQDEQAKAKGVN